MNILRAYRTPSLLLMAILMLTLIVRLYGAWCYQFATNLDHATISLMVKHMYEGRAWPVFFYGQEYMGSLEPVISVFLSFLFGYHGFIVGLGPALLGIIISLTVIYFSWQAGGNLAALAAGFFLIIGPKGYFHYTASPRCYAIQMTCTMAMLILTHRLLSGPRNSMKSTSMLCFLVGMFAGAGWWSSPIIVYTIGTVGLVSMFYLREKINVCWLFCVPGFIAGALPWIYWNVYNDFASMAMKTSIQGGFEMASLYAFWWDRMLRILQLQREVYSIKIFSWVFLATLIMPLYFVIFKRGLLNDRQVTALSLALVFLPVSCFVYVMTDYAKLDTARYHLPIVPVFSVLLGWTFSVIYRRSNYAGIMFILFAVCNQWPNLLHASKWLADDKLRIDDIKPILDQLDRQGIQVVYASPYDRWLNVLTDEKIIFSSIFGDGYEGYHHALENARHPAVLDDYAKFSNLMLYSGGRAVVLNTNNIQLRYNLQSPGIASSYSLDAKQLLIPGGYEAGFLVDRDTSTKWTLTNEVFSFELDLGRDESEMVGIRLWFKDAIYPANWMIEGWSATSHAWEAVFDEMPISSFHWSGPRVYGLGTDSSLSSLFANRYLRYRVTLKSKPGALATLQEVEGLTWLDVNSSAQDGVPDSIRMLLKNNNNVNVLYTYRWLAALLRMESGAINIYDGSFYSRDDRREKSSVIRLKAGDIILVLNHDRAENEAILSEADITYSISTDKNYCVITILHTGTRPKIFDWRDGLYTYRLDD